MPLSDSKHHAFDAQCECGPCEDAEAPGNIIHFAFDGREDYEQGRRALN